MFSHNSYSNVIRKIEWNCEYEYWFGTRTPNVSKPSVTTLPAELDLAQTPNKAVTVGNAEICQ
jgi:hypothetical protein